MQREAGMSTEAWMALAAGSTVAGNFLILGAAGNVIIVQHAEKHRVTPDFHTFAMAGVPRVLVNLAISWGWPSVFLTFR